MDDLGFTNEEVLDIFKVITTILKLGNVSFIPTTNMDGTEGCAISNDYGNKTNPLDSNKLPSHSLCFVEFLILYSHIFITSSITYYRNNPLNVLFQNDSIPVLKFTT